MKNFKAGDKVVRTGMTRRGIQCGKEYEIDRMASCGDLYLKGHSFLCHESQFNFVPEYPNPPHVHAEFIKAWADGAVIQLGTGRDWQDLVHPSWDVDLVYRIKPTKSNDELKLEKMEADALALAEDIRSMKEKLV